MPNKIWKWLISHDVQKLLYQFFSHSFFTLVCKVFFRTYCTICILFSTLLKVRRIFLLSALSEIWQHFLVLEIPKNVWSRDLYDLLNFNFFSKKIEICFWHQFVIRKMPKNMLSHGFYSLSNFNFFQKKKDWHQFLFRTIPKNVVTWFVLFAKF